MVAGFLNFIMQMRIETLGSMAASKANAMGQRDWIAEFEARATKDLRYGHLIGHSHKKKILHILQQLDR